MLVCGWGVGVGVGVRGGCSIRRGGGGGCIDVCVCQHVVDVFLCVFVLGVLVNLHDGQPT